MSNLHCATAVSVNTHDNIQDLIPYTQIHTFRVKPCLQVAYCIHNEFIIFLCKSQATQTQTGRWIPQRQSDLAGPFLPGASLERPAEGLDMVGGRDYNQAELLSEKDWCFHTEESPLG